MKKDQTPLLMVIYWGDEISMFSIHISRRNGRNRGMEGSGVVYRVVGRARTKADCGQQTERPPRQDTTWKKYTDSPGVGAPPMVFTASIDNSTVYWPGYILLWVFDRSPVDYFLFHFPNIVINCSILKYAIFQNQPAPAPPSPSHGRKSDRRAGHHSPQHKREKLTAAQQLGIAPHPQVSFKFNKEFID